MTEPLDKTVFLTLIKEVKSLLPEMEELLSLLPDKDSEKDQITSKLHSLTTTIMGVTSMMNLDELTNTATLINMVLDDIIKDKLTLSPRLIDVMTEIVPHIYTYCSSLETDKDVDNKLFQNALSAFSEFGNFSIDSVDEPEIQKKKPEENFIRQLSEDEDSDAFFEDFDMDIFEENDMPPDIPLETSIPEIIDPEMSDINLEFLESFNEESKDHLNSIGEQLNLLLPLINDRTNISDDYREILHSIRRSVHTLKGAAAVIGIKSVASFGNEFEDFLDWLHDESDYLSPEIITAMLDGTDIFEKLAINPEIQIVNEIDSIKSVFKTIMAESSGAAFEKKQINSSDAKKKQKIEPEIKPVKSSKTLRVDMQKVDQMLGLIGDMTINLSSHEDSSQFLQTTLSEFDNTMKRLKDITLNLEAGLELAEIPHLSSVTGPALKEDQNVDVDIDDFDPLEMDRYSDLHIMIRSLNEAVADLNSIMDQTLKVQNEWHSTMGRQRRVITEIQNSIQLIKMTPFSTLSNRLHKTIRESARVTKKSVQLVLEGDSMEMDTHVWNVLIDPFMHLLRNSVDHGIESPEDRKKSKKSKQATIRIKCIRRGGWLNMHFSDDGKGLDYDAIRKKALKLYPKADILTMDNDELTALIFKHGFSIKAQPTTISGRGVGMDVVGHAVKQLNGNIEVISIAGKGTEFILRIPIAVAQLPALLVKFGQEKFAVPFRDITKVFRINCEQSTKDDYELDNILLPLLRPAEIMELKAMLQPTNDDLFALFVDVGNKKGVLVADAIIGKKDVVFKKLGSHLHNRVPCIAGATIMGNGSLIPILNTEELFSRQKSSIKPVKKASLETNKNDKYHKILIVDDSLSIRKVLTNFVNNQGWHSSVAKDGIDAMEMIRQHSFDLILLDIEMPRMNGFDVLQSLQLHSEYCDIPVLMLTSRSAKKYRNRASELGARGFVTKPFKDDQLLSLINGIIEPALSTRKLKTGN